jgi:TRAP-type C4-dicarboxylate transport system permease small subunit
MLFAAAAVVTAEVLLRKGLGYLVGTSFVFSGSDEISAYLFAVGTSWSMAHVLVTRGHVRIDALYGMLGPRMRGVLDLVALAVLGLFVAVLLERAWSVASTSLFEHIRSNTPLRIPLAVPQLMWLAGIVLFFVALVLAFLRALTAMLRGDLALAAATVGAPSMDEEIEGELSGLGLGAERVRSAPSAANKG